MKNMLALACLAACGTSAPRTPPTTAAQPAPETRPAAEHPVTPPPAPPEPLPPPPPPDRIVRMLVVSAEVAGAMSNGEDWDAKGAQVINGVPAPTARYLEQHPELQATAAWIGAPIDDDKLEEIAAKSPAADPMVIVEIGGVVFRTPVRPRQFNPVWDFPLSFLYGHSGQRAGVPIGAMARFQVVDYDGPHAFDEIGSTLISIDDLLAKRMHVLGPFGAVQKLVVVVTSQPVPEAEPEALVTRLAVPGNASWTDTGIDLIAGQRVSIEAADEVGSKGSSQDHYSGPEGQRRTSSYNQHGFEKLGHGALIGALGDTRFAVGRQLTMVAGSSGRLMLGINDRDTSDNRGSYAVRVVVQALP